jgi:hypothetical protein
MVAAPYIRQQTRCDTTSNPLIFPWVLVPNSDQGAHLVVWDLIIVVVCTNRDRMETKILRYVE